MHAQRQLTQSRAVSCRFVRRLVRRASLHVDAYALAHYVCTVRAASARFLSVSACSAAAIRSIALRRAFTIISSSNAWQVKGGKTYIINFKGSGLHYTLLSIGTGTGRGPKKRTRS